MTDEPDTIIHASVSARLVAGDPYIGKTLLGRYEVLDRLGSGATAHVYLARQLPMEREVALKILRADLIGSEAAVIGERLLREAKLVARLQHPGIVAVHDCGVLENGAVYLAMERLTGVPLSTKLVRPMPVEEAALLICSIVRALAHAHTLGVVHRDIKPSNIFICQTSTGEQIKILDFGIGKGTTDQDPETLVGNFIGTPQYASPEQAMGLTEIDGRSDLYSVGCLFYRMVAGVLPFEADTVMGIAFKQVHSAWPPIEERAGVKVDAGLEAIIKRCMEKNPGDRYKSADELLNALEDWLDRSVVPVAPVKDSLKIEKAGFRWWLLGVPVVLGLGAVLLYPKEEMQQIEMQQNDIQQNDISQTEIKPIEPVEPTPLPLPPPPTAKAISLQTPAPKATSAPVASTPVTVDGVSFSASEAKAAVRWVNKASEEELKAAGITGRPLSSLLSARPFSSLQAIGETSQIGTQTMLNIQRAAK